MNHNVLFVVAATMMDGEFDTASQQAVHLSTTVRSELIATMPILVWLRFGKWKEVIMSPSPELEQPGAKLFWRYARGCALAAEGRLREAEAERDEMEREYARIPPGRAFGMFFNDWSTLNTIALNVLNARIASGQRKPGIAITKWRRAIAAEDQLAFDDLPDWYYPVRESLGALLFRIGQLSEAEKVFREDLDHTPRNPRSLFGLWRTLEAEGKPSEAKRFRRAFEISWKGAPLRIEDL